MTNEELLRKVIEAQVKGGYDRWNTALESYGKWKIKPEIHAIEYESNGGGGVYVCWLFVLEILLDTQGAKAAYGDNKIGLDFASPFKKDILRYHSISDKILDAWHSGEGNNVRAALESAVSFLPQNGEQ